MTAEKLVKMVGYIHAVDLDSVESQEKHRYPFISAELLSSDNAPVLDRFFTGPEILDKLFSILQTEEPINYTSAGYIAKVASALFHRSP